MLNHYAKCVYAFAIALAILSSKTFATDYVKFKGVIDHAVDGDTAHLANWTVIEGNKQILFDKKKKKFPEHIKMRFQGMDTPESHFTPHGAQEPAAQQPWGDQATSYLQSIMPDGAQVEVYSEGQDKYGRVLSTIYVDGKDINIQMLEAGWAAPYIFCTGKTCDEDFFDRQNTDEYLKACEDGRVSKEGIFNPKSEMKEMPFEFRMRLDKRDPDKWVGDFHTKRYYRPADYKKVDLCSRVFFGSEQNAVDTGFKKASSNHANGAEE